MRYILTGFTHDMDFRVFAFECVAEDRSRTACSVKADLSLLRRYGIHVQDLPLLCRGILERRNADEPQFAFTYTEADMCQHASVCAAQAEARKRKTPAHRTPVENAGAAWRGPRV